MCCCGKRWVCVCVCLLEQRIVYSQRWWGSRGITHMWSHGPSNPGGLHTTLPTLDQCCPLPPLSCRGLCTNTTMCTYLCLLSPSSSPFISPSLLLSFLHSPYSPSSLPSLPPLPPPYPLFLLFLLTLLSQGEHRWRRATIHRELHQLTS